jgi:TPR repeat protein
MSKHGTSALALAMMCVLGAGCSGKQKNPDESPTEKNDATETTAGVDDGAEKMSEEEALLAKAYDEDAKRAEEELVAAAIASYKEAQPGAYTDEVEATIATCQADACIEGRAFDIVDRELEASKIIALLPYWFRACETGSAAACSMIGRTYLNVSLSLDEDPRRGIFGDLADEEFDSHHIAFVQRACAIDESRLHCGAWADHYIGEDVRAEDWLAFAVAHLEQRCEAKEKDACRSLGYHIVEENIDRDLSEARAYYKKSCELRDEKMGSVCMRYAEMLYQGVGGDPDVEGAMEYFVPTCTPDSEYWKKSCEGDPATGEEVCGVPISLEAVDACIAVAQVISEKEGVNSIAAARINAAMCRRNFFEEQQIKILGACEAAIAAYTEQGDTQAVSGVAKRYCGSISSSCMMNGEEHETCKMPPDECRAKYGLSE